MSHIIECDFGSGRDCDMRTGRRFGSLVLVDEAGMLRDGTKVWRCVCDCDHVLWATTDELFSGQVSECGLCAAGEWHDPFELGELTAATGS